MLARVFRRGGRLVGPGRPDPIRVEGRRPEVLAIHGFGGTPREVELACDVARELGLAAYAPLLPGHGTHARELAVSRWPDWWEAAEAALDETSEREPAIVVGLSLGSVLAAHLAAERPDRVRALVMLANATWLPSPFPTRALELVDRFQIPDFWLPKAGGADIADDEARRTHLTYDTQPVRAAVDVLRAGERLRTRLGRIECPTLVMHGRRDRVCPVQNAHKVAARLGSVDKEVVLFPRSRHILTRDLERDEVRQRLAAFVERVAG